MLEASTYINLSELPLATRFPEVRDTLLTVFPQVQIPDRSSNVDTDVRPNKICTALKQTFPSLTSDALHSLAGKFMDSANQDAPILKGIFDSSESKHFANAVQTPHPHQDALHLIADEGIVALIDAMMKKPNKYSFQLGSILSFTTLEQLPLELQKKLRLHPVKDDFTLLPFHQDWHLCASTEGRFSLSMKEEGTMVINDKLLFKARGKPTALCLQNFATHDGTVFMRGNYYSPTDQTTREQLTDAFDNGKAKVSLKEGDWALMRAVKRPTAKKGEIFMRVALSHTSGLPDRYDSSYVTADGTELTRRQYRTANFEDPATP